MARRGEEGRMDPRHSWLQGVREHFRNQTRVITPWGHRGRSLPPSLHFSPLPPSARRASEKNLPTNRSTSLPRFVPCLEPAPFLERIRKTGRMAWSIRTVTSVWLVRGSVWERVHRGKGPVTSIFFLFFFFNGEHQYLINNKNAEASSGFQTAFDEKKEKKGKEGLLSLKERTERKYIRRKERSSLKIPCQRDRRGGTPWAGNNYAARESHNNIAAVARGWIR